MWMNTLLIFPHVCSTDTSSPPAYFSVINGIIVCLTAHYKPQAHFSFSIHPLTSHGLQVVSLLFQKCLPSSRSLRSLSWLWPWSPHLGFPSTSLFSLVQSPLCCQNYSSEVQIWSCHFCSSKTFNGCSRVHNRTQPCEYDRRPQICFQPPCFFWLHFLWPTYAPDTPNNFMFSECVLHSCFYEYLCFRNPLPSPCPSQTPFFPSVFVSPWVSTSYHCLPWAVVCCVCSVSFTWLLNALGEWNLEDVALNKGLCHWLIFCLKRRKHHETTLATSVEKAAGYGNWIFWAWEPFVGLVWLIAGHKSESEKFPFPCTDV